jgi:branched-chain amino acid transport system permease protein
MADGMISLLRVGVGFLVAAALIAAFPLFSGPYLTTFMLSVLISFVLAQSWNWIGGEMGYLNLGHYAFYGIGAYAFCLPLIAGESLWYCFLLSIVVPALFAAVLAFPLFRLKGNYFAFATLAMVPLCELLANNLSWLTKGSDGITLAPVYVLGPAYTMAAALALATFAATLLLTGSRFGYALRAIRNDEEVAEVVGVRLFPVKLQMLVLSAAFAGFAGAIQAWQFSYIDPFTMFNLGYALVPVAMALLGGSALLWGPLVGVIILAVAQQWLLVKLNILQGTIYGLVILLIGRYLPGGLLRASVLQRFSWLVPLTREHHARINRRQAETPADGRLPLPPVPSERERVILDCRDVTLAFGGLVAVDGVDLSIRQGEIIGLVGPNGSGKTSLFNLISGVYPPRSGEIVFDGQPLTGLRRDQVARLGIGRTYQIPRPFGDLTVRENIAIALMFRTKGLTLSEAMTQAEPFAAFTGLSRRLEETAEALNLQNRKALELARALAGQPKLLLVDEVASGLSTLEVKRFVEHIREIRDRYGITVIWIEHIFSALAQVVDRIVVLEEGRVIADGRLHDVMQDERVLTTYLGAKGAAE